MKTLTLSPTVTPLEFVTSIVPALDTMLSEGVVEIVVTDEPPGTPGLFLSGTFYGGLLTSVRMTNNGHDEGAIPSLHFYEYILTSVKDRPLTLRCHPHKSAHEA